MLASRDRAQRILAQITVTRQIRSQTRSRLRSSAAAIDCLL